MGEQVKMIVGGPAFTAGPSQQAKMVTKLFGPTLAKACGKDLMFSLVIADAEDPAGAVRGPAMVTNVDCPDSHKGLTAIGCLAATMAFEDSSTCQVEHESPDEAEEGMARA